MAKWFALVILELALRACGAAYVSWMLLVSILQAFKASQLPWLVLVLAWGALELDTILRIVPWFREVPAC